MEIGLYYSLKDKLTSENLLPPFVAYLMLSGKGH